LVYDFQLLLYTAGIVKLFPEKLIKTGLEAGTISAYYRNDTAFNGSLIGFLF